MTILICVNIGSGDGFLPDGTKPLPESILTYHQWGPVTSIFRRAISQEIPKPLITRTSISSSNFIPNRIQQYNRVCMTNITNNRVIIDIVMWFCWWPPEKPWAYQAGSHITYVKFNFSKIPGTNDLVFVSQRNLMWTNEGECPNDRIHVKKTYFRQQLNFHFNPLRANFLERT